MSGAQTSSPYMMVEAFARIDKDEIDPILRITTKAAWSCSQAIRWITPPRRSWPG